MAMGAYDRRGSSIAADVDVAIERLVDHFESSDTALRLDVLRALSAQAQLAFETTRVRERLQQHPVSMDLIQCVTSQSLVYKMLADELKVDSCSCHYDRKRNVVMTTNVRWTLENRKVLKKRKKSGAVNGMKTKEKDVMLTKYRFERVRQKKAEKSEEEETIITFSIVVAFGDSDDKPKELLYFEMACEHSYPKSYYEELRELPSDDEDKEVEELKSTKKKEEKVDQDQGERESFGEEQRDFRFSSDVLAEMGKWMGAEKEELDPVDVIGFFTALPVHEDEWLVDERVCEILFQGGMEADSSDDEGSEKDKDDVS